MPPETPIRDIVDRCRVWESHADPASRRLTKPNPDLIYPAYVVGKADYNTETTRVAEVTGQNSHQLEDLLRRVLSTAERPAPKPEVPEVEKLLQQLVSETQSRPTKTVNPTVTTTLEKMLLSFLDRQRRRQRQSPKQRPASTVCTEWAGLMLCFVGSIWHSCALSYRRTRSCRQQAGHPAPPVLLRRPRQAGRMVSVLRLGHLDIAGGKER